MFRNCIFTKRLFLSPRLKPPIVHVRGLIVKKPKNIFNIFDASFEKYEKTKLVPEGYKLVYVSKNIPLLNMGQIIFYMLCACIVGHVYEKLKHEKHWPYTIESIEVLICLGSIVFLIVIQGSINRSVRFILAKENEFRSIFYGPFGYLTRRTVVHGLHEYYPPKNDRDSFHYLKNKRIILDPESFKDINYYLKVVNC